MWLLVALCAAFLVALLFADGIVDRILSVARAVQTHRFKSVPGPTLRWPLVGHCPVVRAGGGLGKATLALCRQYGSEVVGLNLAGQYCVVACSPRTVREVFTKPEFQARPNNYFTYLRSMKTNKGITMTDGPLWQEQRTFVVKQLSEVGFGKDLMNSMIQDSLQDLIKQLGDGGPRVNLSSYISKSVINILWRIVTGSEIPEEKLSELTELMQARSRAFDQAGGWLAQLPWLRHVLPGWTGYSLISQINSKLRQIITDTIREHKASYREGVTRDFIDAYLHKMYETQSRETTFTDDQLMMVCLDLFIGGIMTTSNSLDFCLLRMVHHPDVQAKTQVELDAVLGNQLPTVQHRNRLPYLRAVVNECLRLSMIAPVNGPRRAVSRACLGGYSVPQGATVLMNMEPVAMDPLKFPQPDLFRPERFLDVNENDDLPSDGDSTGGDNQCYPFGFGKRRCPGEVLARNYMVVVLGGLLQQFDVGPPCRLPVPSLRPTPGITHTPQPYSLSLTKRLRIRPLVPSFQSPQSTS